MKGSLFRSDEMSLVQLFIQAEAARSTVQELGELGAVQFRYVLRRVRRSPLSCLLIGTALRLVGI